jgi:ribosome biogenesis GTPase A
LDAPGVLPNKLNDQLAAVKLAICDDIGEAAYDNQRVAAAFIDRIKAIEAATVLDLRYGLDHQAYSGEAYLHALAEYKYQGDVERSARQLLRDFRIGALGAIALELPPTEDTLVQEDTLV